LLLILFLAAMPWASAGAASASAQGEVVYFLSPESAQLLEGAGEKDDFLPLMAAFVSEERQTFCGIASSVMALNALEIPPPPAPQWYPSQYWSQDTIFTLPALEALKSVQEIEAQGITLAELATLLTVSGAKASPSFAGESSMASFRDTARKALTDRNSLVIVNFARATLGQGGVEGGGHISPIAAYNSASDRFLVLDVARYKYKPSWVTASMLFDAMNTPDSSSGKTRGYVVVQR
jgi:hypothetical protein